MNRQERIERDGLTEDPIEFYGREGDLFYFSNFSHHTIVLPCPFSGGLIDYPTGEHRFQAMKASTKEEHDWVVASATPSEAKKRGRKVQLREGWGNKRFDLCYYVMLEIVLTKANSHDEVLIGLLQTNGRPIWEDSPTDDIWGIRYRNDYRGKNLLGEAWMQAREIIYDSHEAVMDFNERKE